MMGVQMVGITRRIDRLWEVELYQSAHILLGKNMCIANILGFPFSIYVVKYDHMMIFV